MLEKLKNRPVWQATAIHVIIPVGLTIILFAVSNFLFIVPAYKEHMLDAKKEMIRELVNTEWVLLEHYHERVLNDELSLKESQNRAKERIRALRYGPEGKDYFWINDTQSVMIMHPYRRDLEGRDLTDYADERGKYLFREFVKAVEDDGGGFVDYMWQWKDDSSIVVQKLSYVREFEPWGWIIGTGIYIEDVESQIAKISARLTHVLMILLIIIIIISSYIIVHGGRVERLRQAAEDELKELKDNLEIEVQRKKDELVRTQQQLIKAERLAAMGQLAATIAHEFRNQLGVMKNAVYYLGKKLKATTDNKVQRHLRILDEEITRTDDIINDVLSFARAKEPVINTINVKELVTSVRRKIGLSAQRHVTFSVSIAEDVVDMCADETQLTQILVNLLRNAIESIVDTGEVTLAVQSVDGNIQFVIRDTGVGMSAEVQRSIYEPLYTTKARGTGLGLSTVKMLVERHGGSLQIDSVEHQGTTVIVSIPRVCYDHTKAHSTDT